MYNGMLYNLNNKILSFAATQTEVWKLMLSEINQEPKKKKTKNQLLNLKS